MRARFFCSGEQRGGDRPAQEATALSQRERRVPVAVADGETQAHDPLEPGFVECRLEHAFEDERFVEAKPEHHALAAAYRLVELLQLTLGPFAAAERTEVARQPRRVPPTPLLDCRDR